MGIASQIKRFSINIFNIFIKVVMVFIQKVISFRWACICKGKLNIRSLKVFEVQNKPNLNTIFKSYL